jgi:hypothetical protein
MFKRKASWISSVVLSAAVIVAVLIAGCGDDDGTTCTTCGPRNDLVFTRENTSEIVFPSSAVTYVWCGDYDNDVEVPALHIGFGSSSLEDPNWMLTAVVADIELEMPLSFPTTGAWNEPEDVMVFVNDPPNELSSYQSESSGTITFHALPCPGGGSVEFTIDAVLGSELHQGPSVAVTGYFKHELGDPRGKTD